MDDVYWTRSLSEGRIYSTCRPSPNVIYSLIQLDDWSHGTTVASLSVGSANVIDSLIQRNDWSAWGLL